MKLTSQSEYALLALVFLARQNDSVITPADRIAKAQSIPIKFLEQILSVLKRAGLVKSVKGMRGGYKLSRPAAKISLAEVIRIFEGALAPTMSASHFFYESTPIEQEEQILSVFCEIRDMVAKKLENTFLADVV
jgi:Rrf2 family transcriptional regulator, cysteine metabolism repressor